MSDTGERIKQRRKEMGLTADTLAEKLGVSRSTIFRYERGDIDKIPAESLSVIADALNTTPAYLMGWKENDEHSPSGMSILLSEEGTHTISKNSYEDLVVTEMEKMNSKGKIRLLDTAREMTCNPLYNDDYELEVRAAHTRTDIEITNDMIRHDDNIMDDENF